MRSSFRSAVPPPPCCTGTSRSNEGISNDPSTLAYPPHSAHAVGLTAVAFANRRRRISLTQIVSCSDLAAHNSTPFPALPFSVCRSHNLYPPRSFRRRQLTLLARSSSYTEVRDRTQQSGRHALPVPMRFLGTPCSVGARCALRGMPCSFGGPVLSRDVIQSTEAPRTHRGCHALSGTPCTPQGSLAVPSDLM